MSATAKTMAAASPARLYCTLVGGAVAIAGVIGFFYSSGFDSGTAAVRGETEDVLGILAVNGWHNLLHLVLGLAGLASATSSFAARTYCLAVGLAYVLLAIWGFGFDEDGVILGLLPLNDADNLLHLILGLTGLGAGAATPAVTRPARPRRDRATRRSGEERRERARPDAKDEPDASERRGAGGRRSRPTQDPTA